MSRHLRLLSFPVPHRRRDRLLQAYGDPERRRCPGDRERRRVVCAMTVRVKICGITTAADALATVAAGADALGFVFVRSTPREITAPGAARLIRRLPPFVARVGLFVDAELSFIRDVIDEAGLDTVQLHGDESPDVCHALRPSVKVLKAFRVRDAETLAQLPLYQEAADAFLLDAYVPGRVGGTGATFDWEQAVAAKRWGHPLILAGGLTPENVAQAVRRVEPFAVDVSSGVESALGKKDPDKIRRFVAAAKGSQPGSVAASTSS